MSDSFDPLGVFHSSSNPTSHPSSSAPLQSSWNYETTVAQIEAIIARIEMGELDLAEVFEQFGNAVERLRQCEMFLTHQKQQMDLLIETLVDEPEAF